MAGQGTLALELFEDVRELDLLLVPVGGGGLAAGVGTVAKALAPRCTVVGVEPALADDTHRSFYAGQRLPSERLATELLKPGPGPSLTIADGLRTPVPGALTFPINRANLAALVLVSEEDIVAAMRFCFEAMKLVVEPSGAVCIAALLTGAVEARGTRVGVVISGGNIDVPRFVELTGDPSRRDHGCRAHLNPAAVGPIQSASSATSRFPSGTAPGSPPTTPCLPPTEGSPPSSSTSPTGRTTSGFRPPTRTATSPPAVT